MEVTTIAEGRSWIEHYYARIYDLHQNKSFDQCLSLIDDGLAIWPDDPYMLLMKGFTLTELGQISEAINVFRCGKSKYISDMRFTGNLGEELMYQGYYFSALEVLDQYLCMSPGSAGYNLFVIHMCNVMVGNNDQVLEFCDLLEKTFGDKPGYISLIATIHALRSLCFLNSNDLDKSLEYVNLAYEKDPASQLVAYAAGVVSLARESYIDAELYLRKAVDVQPRDMQAREKLAIVLEKTGQLKEAEKIRATISGFFGSPDTDPDPVIRGVELLCWKRYQEALAYLLEKQDGNQDNPVFIITLMKAYYFTGDYRSVISLAKSAPDTPDYWNVLYLKAAAYYASNQMEETYKSLVLCAIRDHEYFLGTLNQMKEAGFFSLPSPSGSEAIILALLIKDGPESVVPLMQQLVHQHSDEMVYAQFLAILCVLTKNVADALKYSEIALKDNSLESNIIQIITLRNTGCLKDAEEMGKKIISDDPSCTPALYQYVRALIEQDNYRLAYGTLLSVRPSPGQDPWILELLIRCLIRSGDYSDAARVAYRIINDNQNRPLNYTLLGKTFLLDRSLAVANYAFIEEIRLNGLSSDLIIHYSQSLIQSGDSSEASRYLNHACDFIPDNARTRYLKAVAKVLSGKSPETEANPDYISSVFETENPSLRFFIGDYREAGKRFQEEIRNQPHDRNTRMAYAMFLYDLERPAETLHQLSIIQESYGDLTNEEKTLMKDSLFTLRLHGNQKTLQLIAGNNLQKFALLMHERAKRLSHFGMKKMAISVCMQVTDIRSENPHIQALRADAFHMLGDLEREKKRYEQARTVYDLLLAKYPKNAKWLAEKGLVLNNYSQYQNAKEILLEALDIDSENGIVYSALCWCLACLGESEQSLIMGNRAVQLIPDDWGAWNNRGLAREQLGDYDGAMNDYRQALRCSPSELIAFRNLCAILMNLEDDDALEVYGDMLVKFGNFSEQEQSAEIPNTMESQALNVGTATGYLEGYW